MTNKRTFEFPGQRPASDYEETAELPVQTEPPLVTVASDMDLTQTLPAEGDVSIFDYEANETIDESHFAEAPRYEQLSSYERLLNVLWYEKRRDFLTVIAALGLLVLGISAFVLLLNGSPTLETAVELSSTKKAPKSTFLFPPAGPAITPATTAASALPTQSPQTQAPTTATTIATTIQQDTSSATSEPTASSLSSLDALLLDELEQTTIAKKPDKVTKLSTIATTEKITSTAVVTTAASRSAITPQKISLDATLTKINFTGNFCASAYTLTLASEERSLDRTVDKSAEECSKSWPAYFTGLIAGQKYQLTIGAAHKETGEIIYSSTSFIAE